MSITGVSVTKSFSFRGAAQEFSNTYYYRTPLPVPAAIADGLIDAIVAKEKAIFGTSVTFVRARAWSAGGTKAENQGLAAKNLSGTGSQSVSGSSAMDRERAFLVRFRAGVDSRGRPVYLRKWWHLDVSAVGASSITNAQMQNTATLDTAQRNALVSAGDTFKAVTVAPQSFDLVSEKNRSIDGATQAHAYLEHHQLGDMWR